MTISESIYTAIVRSGRSNSSIIMDNTNLVLIDCGAGPRVLEDFLNNINTSIDKITGAVITHSHSDHMNEATLRKLASNGIPIYCNDEVKKIAIAAIKDESKKLVKKNFHEISVRNEFIIGDFKIKAFNLSHDSDGGCYGYVFKKKTSGKITKIVYATDFGYPSQSAKRLFRDADIMFIESDHCDIMLDKCFEIPEDIKENHIRKYHISTTQCSALLEEIFSESDIIPRKIHLLHIADKINTDNKALSICKRMLKKNGFKNVLVSV